MNAMGRKHEEVQLLCETKVGAFANLPFGVGVVDQESMLHYGVLRDAATHPNSNPNPGLMPTPIGTQYRYHKLTYSSTKRSNRFRWFTRGFAHPACQGGLNRSAAQSGLELVLMPGSRAGSSSMSLAPLPDGRSGHH